MRYKAREFCRDYPDIAERVILFKYPEKKQIELLSETALRIFWNILNENKYFDVDPWDEDSSVGLWFDGYNLSEVSDSLTEMGKAVDPDSGLFFDEVVDHGIIQVRADIRKGNINVNPVYQVHRFVELIGETAFMEDLGDFRILDWNAQKEKSRYEQDDFSS